MNQACLAQKECPRRKYDKNSHCLFFLVIGEDVFFRQLFNFDSKIHIKHNDVSKQNHSSEIHGCLSGKRP